MNQKDLKELIDLFLAKEELDELEVKRSGVRLRICRSSKQDPSKVSQGDVPSSEQRAVGATTASTSQSQSPAESSGLFYVTSPIVGTFYRAPTPDLDPFVGVGDSVEKGSVVCIVEAMKLMNEIESEVAGEIVSILVENGQSVEYGERLFEIRSR